ncbi:hypothetical protein K2Q00_02235 [Patescibacteria group bacterium]|nr:hypothetical protein [Patescibacteria group bacterium]
MHSGKDRGVLPDISSIVEFSKRLRDGVSQTQAQHFIRRELKGEVKPAGRRQIYKKLPERTMTRCVRVTRLCTAQAMIDATDRRRCVDPEILISIPKCEESEGEVTLYFLEITQPLLDFEVERLYKEYGLQAADPYSLAAANELDPCFADEYPNATHWKLPGEGMYGEAIWGTLGFSSAPNGDRWVVVQRYDNTPFSGMWFACMKI